MTKKQAEKRIKELMRTEKELIWKKVQKALDSGGLNLPDYEDNYLLPKIIMSAVHGEMEWQYKPHTEEDQKTVKNLKVLI